MSNLKKFVIALLLLVVLIPAGAFGYVYFKLNSIHDNTADSKILNKINHKEESGITNILLVGIDARNIHEKSRSDSMMILTVDNKHKSLKLTSLARDTYVDIPGHGMEKLTHAYAYGGINLLVETVENNFKLDIQNYAIVNFFSFMDIVDTLGGVTVDVHQSELNELRKYTQECYELNTNKNKGDLKFIDSSGTQKLNGYQALAYARIRYNDTAMERDRRQREIMQGLATSFKNLSVTKYPKLIDTILPYVKTNMKPTEIIKLGTNIVSIGNFDIKQLEFPVEKYSKGGIVGSDGWVLQFDSDKNLPILHDFIFKNVMYNDTNY
ncbi:LCP family protein [Paraclostridium bifermentans]|uniref:LCP family protein n=1 Tax=Paraclostridium bifermentans TaxID=1490 RepID=UPI00189C023A|nr:LCP family protein [Paraclostridium bifermentans]